MLVNAPVVFSSRGFSAPYFPPCLCTTCPSCWHQLSRGDWQVWYLAFTSRLKRSHAAADSVCMPGKHPSPANAQPCHCLSQAANIHSGSSIRPAPPATNSPPLIFSYQPGVLPSPVWPTHGGVYGASSARCLVPLQTFKRELIAACI